MAVKANISIDQGATYQLILTCLDSTGAPLDLTGYTGAAQVRGQYADASPQATFTASVGGVAGTVTLTLTAAQTLAITVSTGVWDCKITDGSGNVTRVCQGVATINPEATR